MKEIRNNEQINTSNESRIIEGYAIVFDSESKDLGGFKEIISRNAITQDTLNKSDILFLLDHNKERGILARSKYGDGSLKLELDNIGLKFSFEAPETSLGDEILIGLRRKDISQCSFAFTVAEDKWEKRNDGSVLRTIENIYELFDLSIVYNPAYDSTSVNIVNKRGLEKLMNEEIRTQEEEKEIKEMDEMDENQTENETPKEEKSTEEDNEKELSEDTEKEEDNENKTQETEEDKEVKSDCKKEDEKRSSEIKIKENNLYNKENKVNRNMSKFSLLKTINDVVNNRNLDDSALNVIKEGRNAANIANVETNGQIVLALEKRAEGDTVVNPNGILATVAEQGKEAIPTDTFEIVGALRDKMVLAEAGAQFMSLQGNVEIPIYSGSNCTWESEVGEAKDGSGKFTSVKLTPKRLTATLPISRQFLIQSSDSAEALLRNDLINCIAEKLQKTILGNGEGDNVTPKGLFYGVTADTATFSYDDAVNMEASLESANVYGDYKWVVSPNAKAVLRTTSMDKGSGKFIYENNAVLGIDAHSTNSVVNKGVVIGDWRELIIGAFGALDIVVDPYTAAAKGQVILTVNAFFDYVERRPEAFVKRILK